MPESRKRKKPTQVYTPPPVRSKSKQVSPPWFGALILGLFLIGIVYLVLFYVTNNGVPGLEGLRNYNILVGFSFIIAGFALATQWK